MRWTSLPEWAVPAGGFLGVLAAVETVLRGEGAGVNSSTAMLLGLCATLPVAFLLRQTVPAAATVAAANALALLVYGRPTVGGLAALAVAAPVLGLRTSGRTAALVVAPLVAGGILVLPFAHRADQLWAVAIAAVAAGGAGMGAGRRAREQAAERAQSRQTFADSLLEHAARGERARIARELHDVVAHHISMIAVQAETARLATPGMPPDGARRLLEIGDTARSALTEMRRLLGVLREDAGPAPAVAARRPQPGLQQLNELIDEARASARASVRLIVRGAVAPLDPGIELTAYRIVQEALTNARRHAPGAAVDVELDYTRDGLDVRVRDNGPGSPGDRVGHGLLGMRERAAAVGGELRTGRAGDGGFVIEARLPSGATS